MWTLSGDTVSAGIVMWANKEGKRVSYLCMTFCLSSLFLSIVRIVLFVFETIMAIRRALSSQQMHGVFVHARICLFGLRLHWIAIQVCL